MKFVFFVKFIFILKKYYGNINELKLIKVIFCMLDMGVN